MNIKTSRLFLHLSLKPQYRRLKNSETMKVFTQKKNPITGVTEWDIQHEDYDYHQEIARAGFADMLHDKERNQKYYSALKLAIDQMHADGKAANVLDIGTGTGLLSIMAFECGADSIVACEAFKPMSECCIEILKTNGLQNNITVIPKRSTELTVGEDGDMKQKANILVTEVFDTELIGEGALSSFSHAHKYLLEEDCIVVPDSAIMYVQVVECAKLQKWNKLNDLYDEDLQLILRAPHKMKNCAGSAAVHDIQLSQLQRSDFRELSIPIPVFQYDWSGRSGLELNRTLRHTVKIHESGTAQVVFMWWVLHMDRQRKIVLSCAPWWNHPDVNAECLRPQDTIPWRDHWMQAVYYLPRELSVNRNAQVTLIACQDEYSLWFYLEDEKTKYSDYKRPICECGVHMIFSRTHVSYLNDGRRSKYFLARMRDELDNRSVVLDLNGSSFMGLAAAKMGAKSVYVLESLKLNLEILSEYAQSNEIKNVTFIPDVTDQVLREVTHVVCDPNYSSAILPWENLKMAYLLHKFKGKLRDFVTVIPEGCEFWGMPVQFNDLHKIKAPLNSCEGINMKPFDELLEKSRDISDDDLEAQPLWEYPCICRGQPQRLLTIDLNDLKPTYAAGDSFLLFNPEPNQVLNGFVVWTTWTVGDKTISCGPVKLPTVGEYVQWDPHTRQAVKIMNFTYAVREDDKWSYQIACDLEKGQFDIVLDLLIY